MGRSPEDQRAPAQAALVDPALVDVDAVPLSAFCLTERLEPGAGAWHAHRFHQLLYVETGAPRLMTREAAWLLPTHRAGFVRAGTEHALEVSAPSTLRAVYLSAELLGDGSALLAAPALALAVPELIRQMLLFAARWGPDRLPGEALAESFFATLALLLEAQARAPLPLSLARAKSEAVERAMRYTEVHLEEGPQAEEVARAAGVSVRTLARRFREETGAGWHAYYQRARMLSALERLSAPGSSSTEVAFALGFESASAFSHAFRRFFGRSPREHLRRG